MKLKVLVVCCFVTSFLAACSSTSKNDSRIDSKIDSRKIFTKKDYAALTYCMGLSYSAMRIAAFKIKGSSIDDVKKTISKDATKKNRELAEKLIERVYKEEVESSWGYSVKFFKGCSNNVAKLYEPHTKYATYCLMNSYIGNTAYSFKIKELGKDKAYAFFEKFSGETPKKIIDNTYEKVDDRQSARLIPWRACMAIRVADE